MGLLGIYLTIGWLPTLIRESGISIERAATVTGLFQIRGTVGAIAAAWIMDRPSPTASSRRPMPWAGRSSCCSGAWDWNPDC